MYKNKSAFTGYTEKEVVKMENRYFCLVMGGDFVQHDNIIIFTEREVNKLYKNVLEDLIGIAVDGTEKDKSYALQLISGLSIQRLKLH